MPTRASPSPAIGRGTPSPAPWDGRSFSPGPSGGPSLSQEPLSKIFAEAEADAVQSARGKVSGVFQDYPDVSAANKGMAHNTSKVDTFKTAQTLNQKYDVPTRLDKRWGLGDSRDLIEICEIGFARSMRLLGKEILQECRDELQQSRDEMTEQTRDIRENQDVTLGAMLSQIHEKVESIVRETTRPAKLDLANADLVPLRDFLIAGDEARWKHQEQSIQRLEDHFNHEVKQLTQQVSVICERQAETDTTVLPEIKSEIQKMHKETEEQLSRSEKYLEKLVSAQEGIVVHTSKTAEDVDRLRKGTMKSQEDLAPVLDQKFTEFLSEKCVNVDFAQVVGRITKVERKVTVEFEGMLGEIAKIQQALHLDFAQVSSSAPKIEMLESTKDLTFGDIVVPFGGKGAAMPALEALSGNKATGTLSLSAASKFLKTVGGGVPKAASSKLRRIREMSTQTQGVESCENGAMTDPVQFGGPKQKRYRKVNTATAVDTAKVLIEKTQEKRVFADKEAMKAKAREAAIKPQYNVFDHYKDQGWAQAIAKSKFFEMGTLLIIFFNAIWISVDLDNNEATVLYDAHPVFQVAENLFCFYFTWEVCVRFAAFHKKWRCLLDSWFVFDTCLVSLMVIETWFITILILAIGTGSGAGLGNTSMFRMIRLVKMFRISRLARLLRAIPELVILLKGIGAAARSVLVFLVLWLIIIYVFAVLCRQITDGSDIGAEYFPNVGDSMNTLLLDGILPDNALLVKDLSSADPWLWPVLMLFILLACITLMYMLIGVLVEIVAVIATTEKESMTVSAVATELRDLLEDSGRDIDANFTKLEFQNLLTDENVVKILRDVGVDAVVLLDFSDIIFEDLDKKGGAMSFGKFVDVVLNMRGTNAATVKDMKEQLRVLKGFMKDATKEMLKQVEPDFKAIKTTLLELKDAAQKEDEEEFDDDAVVGSSPSHKDGGGDAAPEEGDEHEDHLPGTVDEAGDEE